MKLISLIFILLMPNLSFAVEPSEMLADPVKEARARELSKGLRCLVCRNQSIDDSNSGLARDLRVLLRERLTAGDSDEAAMQYLVNRFGDYVLLKPPFKLSTALLWLGPLLLITFGAGGFYLWWRKQPQTPAPIADLSEDDRALLNDILSKKDPL
jgi:cytochrome c-type biogenesis protein CcmH